MKLLLTKFLVGSFESLDKFLTFSFINTFIILRNEDFLFKFESMMISSSDFPIETILYYIDKKKENNLSNEKLIDKLIEDGHRLFSDEMLVLIFSSLNKEFTKNQIIKLESTLVNNSRIKHLIKIINKFPLLLNKKRIFILLKKCIESNKSYEWARREVEIFVKEYPEFKKLLPII